MNFSIVIPARYGSSRLPGKPLLQVAGKALLEWVIERAVAARPDQVVVATDDRRICELVERTEARCLMTRSDHQSGTDRLAEVCDLMGWPDDQTLVNLQGDEPEMPPALLRQVALNLASHPQASMATLAIPIREVVQMFDPHVVKVVRDNRGMALYFSRGPIPWSRNSFGQDSARLPEQGEFLRHIGLYAYRAGFLRRFVQWPQHPLERAEKLEQLRALLHREPIHVDVAEEDPGIGVDTADDLARAARRLAAG